MIIFIIIIKLKNRIFFQRKKDVFSVVLEMTVSTNRKSKRISMNFSKLMNNNLNIKQGGF